MAKTSLGRKRTGLNELGHHVLRKNHASLFGSHTTLEKLVLGLEGTRNRVLKEFTGLVLIGLVHRIDLITALLLVGRTCTELSG